LDVDLTVLGRVSETCLEYPEKEQCKALEISLPRNTEVMACLAQTAGWSQEAARELGILVNEANSIVRLLDQERAAR